MRGEVSARGARGGCVVQRGISERYLGNLDRGRWLSRLFWLWGGSGSGGLTRWIGEMFLCMRQRCRSGPLGFLRTFRVREDRKLGGCCGSGRDHRDLYLYV